MAELKGMDNVLRNLNKEIEKMGRASGKGLIKSAVLLRRSMETDTPLIPIDTGNLRASWFTDLRKHREGYEMRLGFTANYAWYVHENVGANFKRPGAGAKFFEAALKRNTDKILEIIRREARV